MKWLLLTALVFSHWNTMAFEGYDNSRGRSIGQCVREKMIAAPEASTLDAYEPGKQWKCHELYYLWDNQDNLAIFTHNRGADFSPLFRFDYKTDSHGTYLVENKMHRDRVMVDFSNPYQHGMVTMGTTGLPPHFDYYFVKGADGYLYWEKFTKEWNDPRNPMTQYWPAIHEHPMALLGDTPTRPDTWVRRALGYGVCFLEDQTAPQAPCFSDFQ